MLPIFGVVSRSDKPTERAFCVREPVGVSLEDVAGRRDVCDEAHHAPAALWGDTRRCPLLAWYGLKDALQQATGDIKCLGGVQGGDRDGREQRRHPVQQRFDGTRGWQVQEKPVLVLFDLRGHCAECQDHGSGLGRGEGRMGERVRPEGMVQDVGTTGEEQPCGVGEKCRRRRAVTGAVALDRLDIVFAIAPSAVAVLVHVLGWRVRHRCYDKPRVVPRSHAFGFDDDPPRLLPGGGGRGEVLIETAAGRQRLIIGKREGRPLSEQVAGRLHGWGRLAEEHGIARQAKDEIAVAPRGKALHDLWGREVTSATHEEGGSRPVVPEVRSQAHQDHRIFQARGPLAWAEAGGHQGVGGACKETQRQVAMTLIVVILAGACLLARRGVLRVIEVKAKRRWRLGVTRHEMVHNRARPTGEIGARHAVFEAREGRGAGEVLGRLQGDPLYTELQHGVVPKAIGIVAVGIPAGDLIETLGEEVAEGMIDIRRVAPVTYGSGQALGQADLAVDTAQQEGTKVRR